MSSDTALACSQFQIGIALAQLLSAVVAATDARLDVWEGMVHGFPGSVGRLTASDEALQPTGEFLIDPFPE